MFDVGFSELMVIGIVALVVIGPERLPKVARTVGLLLGRLQRYVSDVKADINREMQLDELKKLQSDVRDSAREFERSIAGEAQAVEKGVAQTIESTTAEIQQLSTEATEKVAAPEASENAEQTAVRSDGTIVPLVKG